MNNADLIQSGNKNIHQSIIVRYWRGSDGSLRGQLLDPVTLRVFTFTSLTGLHEVLNQVILDHQDVSEEPKTGGELT